MIRTTEYVLLIAFGLAVGLNHSCSRQEMTLVDVNRPMTLAVSPALNHSGSQDFDPLRVADLMASELAQLPGVRVIPLNRVLAQLESEGRTRIESAGQALQVTDRVGADAMLVFAVTEYDPYLPPVVGISAQLYGTGLGGYQGIDPITASRQARPVHSAVHPAKPHGEYQRVFLGSDERVHDEIRDFARQRDADHSPYGWKRYLASQEEYLRFCCHVTARELIRQEVTQVAAWRERQDEEEPE